MRSTRWLMLAALAAACSSSHSATNGDMAGPMRPAGFNPPPLEAGETEYDSPIISQIPPGSDITYCSYLDATITDETDVIHYRVFGSLTSHHAILYAAKQPKPVDTHVCTEDDMVNGRFLAGGGAEGVSAITIPDGLAFRIPANTQLMIQTHWINATQNPVDGQAVAYITAVPSSPSRQTMDLFDVVNTSFTLPAGQVTTATSTCTVQKDLNIFALAGHMHEFGQHFDYKVADAGGANTQMLWSKDWAPEYQSAPPYTVYGQAQPLVLKAGQQVSVTCTWNNTTGNDMAFPREMCVGTSFYFPATDGEIDCIDGHW